MVTIPLPEPHDILPGMTTSLLFYESPRFLDASAKVLKVIPDGQDRLGLVLDRTPFYPEGGGQPCDLGTISGFPVHSVAWVGDEIVHGVHAGTGTGGDSGTLSIGAQVRCVVNPSRRRDHTEQHTAQHLLSATVLRLLGAPTRSFHLGERYSTIDVDIAVMDRADADAVEAAVMEVVRDDYPITTHLCPPEDPDSFPLRRKPPADAEILRILEIDGIDFTPCAGTHLQNTGAIQAFRILKTEKYKGMTRIYFLAGGRAQVDYGKLAALVRVASAAAGCADDDVALVMGNLMEKTAKLETELKTSLDRIAAFELRWILDMLPGTAGTAGAAGTPDSTAVSGIDATELGHRSGPFAGTVLLLCADRDYADVSRLAKAGAGLGRNTIAVSGVDKKIAAASVTIDGRPDLGTLLKPLMLIHGGKGGGSGFFQAAFPSSGELDAFIHALGGNTN